MKQPESISRTVRFRPNDVELIAEFLAKNPLFDFSSLARIAILDFVKNPRFTVEAVGTSKVSIAETAKPTKEEANGSNRNH